jgi:hypothetical protein
VRLILIGDTLAGKSTIAAHLALLLAKVRKLETRPSAILTRSTTAYRPYEIDVARCLTLNGLVKHLHAAQGPLIVDDFSEFYALLRDAYLAQTAEQRDRAGLMKQARLGPDAWNAINLKYRSVFTKAASVTVDVIEIYRRGPVYVNDYDLGSVEGEGVKTRGPAEGGGGGDIVLLLDGGLRARRRESGSRLLSVLSDTAQLANGKELRLPQITSAADSHRLSTDLSKLLLRSLTKLVQWADEEARMWADLDELPDIFPEVRESVRRAEAVVVTSRVDALLQINGLAGQKGEVKQARAQLLFDSFGVGDTDALAEVPVEDLRGALPKFERALAEMRAPQ